jgi:hypothetical protein
MAGTKVPRLLFTHRSRTIVREHRLAGDESYVSLAESDFFYDGELTAF